VSATTYRVDERYKLVEHLGQGAYGVVIAADDFETGKSVAIKVIDNAFNHIAFTKRTLRELKVLRHLKHDNILGINSIMTFGGVHDFTHVCIVTDLFETDLGAVLKSNQNLTLVVLENV
ncbi:protein kinase, putative, partial [Perkinsus marinus ATCC 50983]